MVNALAEKLKDRRTTREAAISLLKTYGHRLDSEGKVALLSRVAAFSGFDKAHTELMKAVVADFVASAGEFLPVETKASASAVAGGSSSSASLLLQQVKELKEELKEVRTENDQLKRENARLCQLVADEKGLTIAQKPVNKRHQEESQDQSGSTEATTKRQCVKAEQVESPVCALASTSCATSASLASH